MKTSVSSMLKIFLGNMDQQRRQMQPVPVVSQAGSKRHDSTMGMTHAQALKFSRGGKSVWLLDREA